MPASSPRHRPIHPFAGGLALALGLIAALVLSAFPDRAAGAKWTRIQPAASKSRELTGFSADVGESGYAAMAYVIPGESLEGAFEGAVFVKVRKPGRHRFQPAVFRGITHTRYTDLEIGPGGLTLLTYRGENGRWRVSTKWPRVNWIGTQELEGASVGSNARIEIGPGGEAALLGRDHDGAGGSVSVALRDPGSGIFEDWSQVSADSATAGRFADIAPGISGRWTVVWSTRCSPGEPGALWVELDPPRPVEPRAVPGAGCVSKGLDAQTDRHGNQYVRLGQTDGVQLAIRGRGDDGFPPAVTVSGPRDRTDGGHLSVSGNGAATLIWGRLRGADATRDGYLYVRSMRGSLPTHRRRVKGTRFNHNRYNDALRAVSPLPHGRMAMIFTQSWFTQAGLRKDRIGTSLWKAGSRLRRPRYVRPTPAGRFVDDLGIETSFRGAAFAWWSTQTELGAEPVGHWWRGRF